MKKVAVRHAEGSYYIGTFIILYYACYYAKCISIPSNQGSLLEKCQTVLGPVLGRWEQLHVQAEQELVPDHRLLAAVAHQHFLLDSQLLLVAAHVACARQLQRLRAVPSLLQFPHAG